MSNNKYPICPTCGDEIKRKSFGVACSACDILGIYIGPGPNGEPAQLLGGPSPEHMAKIEAYQKKKK